MYRFGGFELDERRAELRTAGGAIVKLRPKSFDLLKFFAANAGQVLTKRELIDAVWPNIHVSEDSLFQCVREIRSALGDTRRQLIKSVPGRGYLFELVPTEECADTSAETVDSEPIAPPAAVANGPMPPPPAMAGKPWHRPVGYAVGIAAVAAIVGFAIAAPMLDLLGQKPLSVAVMPLGATSADAPSAAMAARVTDNLTDGLARIDNFRVVVPPKPAGNFATGIAASDAPADYVLSGELERVVGSWSLRARLTRVKTGDVAWTMSVSVPSGNEDLPLQETRLAAGIGHSLALRVNALQYGAASGGDTIKSSAQVAVDQAVASTNQISRERFAVAEKILGEARLKDPGNVDIEAALAALQLRGIQMAWYGPDDAVAAENNARAVLEHALSIKPNYIPVLETYCRFLTATNKFVESLVACAKVVALNPWDGIALFNLGTTQVQLGRFEDALTTYRRAERFDTPSVSRWTWALGLGWTYALMGLNEAALPWLQKSLAITPGTGRTHLLLAAVYQQLGRDDEAKAALAAALALRPGSTTTNTLLPTENVSPLYLAESQRILRIEAQVGLPER